MINLDQEVFDALNNDAGLILLLSGRRVYEPNRAPDDENRLPAIIYEEISNVPALAADDEENASRVTYSIRAYTWDDNLLAIINAIERVMIAINFTRHSSLPAKSEYIDLKGKEILFITTKEC